MLPHEERQSLILKRKMEGEGYERETEISCIGVQRQKVTDDVEDQL